MYSAQSMMLFGVSLLVAAALVFGCLQWRRFRQRRKKEMRKRKLVMDAVQAAINECSLFDLHVKNDKGVVVRNYRAQCVAVSLYEASLILEGPVSPAGWSGREVQVYFRLASPEPIRFFDFIARVKDAACEQGYTRLVLPLPMELGSGQRRIHERLRTPDFTLPGFRLWFGKLFTRLASPVPLASSPVPADVATLSARPTPVMPFVGEGSPKGQGQQDGPLAVAAAKVAKSRLKHSLSWRPVPLGEVRVLDVSAGGAKLLLPSSVHGLWDDIRPGQLLLIQTIVPVAQQMAPKPKTPRATVPVVFPVAFPETAEAGQSGLSPVRTVGAAPQEQTNAISDDSTSDDEERKNSLVFTSMNLAIVGEVLRASPAGPDPSVIRVAVRFRRWMRVIPEARLGWTILQSAEGIAPLGQWIRRRLNELATPTGEPALEAKDFDLCLYDKEED